MVLGKEARICGKGSGNVLLFGRLKGKEDFFIVILLLPDNGTLVPLSFQIEIHHVPLKHLGAYSLPLILLQKLSFPPFVLQFLTLIQHGVNDPSQYGLNESGPFELFEGEGFAAERAGVFVTERLFQAW